MADRTGSRGGTIHSLEEARDLQTTGKPADRWSTVIRTAIIETLLEQGQYHADDLIPIGIPDTAANKIGAQVGALVSKRYIVEIGRRKAAAGASHGRKSGVYEFTDFGKRMFTGIDAGEAATPTTSCSSVDPGDRTCTRPAGEEQGPRQHSEPTPAGVPQPPPAGPGSPGEAAAATDPEGRRVGGARATVEGPEPEPLRLFEDTDQTDRKAA